MQGNWKPFCRIKDHTNMLQPVCLHFFPIVEGLFYFVAYAISTDCPDSATGSVYLHDESTRTFWGSGVRCRCPRLTGRCFRRRPGREWCSYLRHVELDVEVVGSFTGGRDRNIFLPRRTEDWPSSLNIRAMPGIRLGNFILFILFELLLIDCFGVETSHCVEPRLQLSMLTV